MSRTLVSIFVSVLMLALVPMGVQAQNTYTVTNTNDSGTGSLRAAINNANDGSGTPADTIEFDISGTASPSSPHVIQPDSELPRIDDPVVIDGTTEPDYGSGSNPKPVIELDGTNAGTSFQDGLFLFVSGNTVKGLAIINFDGNGISAGQASDQTIVGCHVGVRADGSTAAGNGTTAVNVGGNAQIGGTGADASNIIGNGSTALRINGSNTIVQGNFVGTNDSGKDFTSATGIDINGASQTVIGGVGSGEANVITAAYKGVTVRSGGTGNAIRGNEIFDTFGIDLGDDFQTANDAGDSDDGNNRLQNFPEIQSAEITEGGDVKVTYIVPSDPNVGGSGTSAYPLTVDVYKADAADDNGKAYLGTDTYSESSPDDYAGCGSPPCPVTATITPPSSVSLSESDDVVATATDDNGNTSEFSAGAKKLPVEIASFDATRGGEASVDLSWTTVTETNNAGFRVQHQGPKAVSWSKLGFVEGNGTTTNAQSYQFTAEDLSVGTHRFRLQQVDIDGSTTLHDPVTVDLQMTKSLRLAAPSPNPVRGTATASFAVKEAVQTQVTLYNVLGQQVTTLYRGTPTAGEAQSIRVRTSDLASGVYFLRLQADGQSRTERLTVVR